MVGVCVLAVLGGCIKIILFWFCVVVWEEERWGSRSGRFKDEKWLFYEKKLSFFLPRPPLIIIMVIIIYIFYCYICSFEFFVYFYYI